MAKCEKRQIVPDPPPLEYVLTLSEDEARELRHILGFSTHVASNCLVRTVWKSLCDAGVRLP